MLRGWPSAKHASVSRFTINPEEDPMAKKAKKAKKATKKKAKKAAKKK